jgi:hypothetical protein
MSFGEIRKIYSSGNEGHDVLWACSHSEMF